MDQRLEQKSTGLWILPFRTASVLLRNGVSVRFEEHRGLLYYSDGEAGGLMP